MINYEQAKAMFARESFLFGKYNGIPELRAIELFGEYVVRKAMKTSKGGEHYNVWYYNVAPITYLYFEGFCYVVTYANLEELAKREEKCGAVD